MQARPAEPGQRCVILSVRMPLNLSPGRHCYAFGHAVLAYFKAEVMQFPAFPHRLTPLETYSLLNKHIPLCLHFSSSGKYFCSAFPLFYLYIFFKLAFSPAARFRKRHDHVRVCGRAEPSRACVACRFTFLSYQPPVIIHFDLSEEVKHEAVLEFVLC